MVATAIPECFAASRRLAAAWRTFHARRTTRCARSPRWRLTSAAGTASAIRRRTQPATAGIARSRSWFVPRAGSSRHGVAMATRRQVQPAPSDAWGPLPPHATEPRPRWLPAEAGRSSLLRWLERALLVLAIVCLGYYGYVSAETILYQAYENRELDALLTRDGTSPPAGGTAAVPARPLPARGATVGRIEIPRLGVSAIIKAGTDARTLQLAVGHIPGTALPGETGNIGLAAHRDTFFRRLRYIRPNDEIRLVTADGTFVFSVQRTRIVWPKDTWVLDATASPTLTLVTCYPFTYIGAAPQRFIVHAVGTTSVPANAPVGASVRR